MMISSKTAKAKNQKTSRELVFVLNRVEKQHDYMSCFHDYKPLRSKKMSESLRYTNSDYPFSIFKLFVDPVYIEDQRNHPRSTDSKFATLFLTHIFIGHTMVASTVYISLLLTYKLQCVLHDLSMKKCSNV
jgi:hypothetical protein